MTATALPKAIQDQEDKANLLIGQVAKGEIVDVIVDDPEQDQDPTKKPVDQLPKVPPSQASPGPEDDFKQKYDVLQGKYNHETADLRRQLNQSHDTISRQNQMILDLHNRLSALENGGGAGRNENQDGQGGEKETAPKLKKLNKEDFEGYGPEMSDLIEGFNVLLDENAQLKANVTSAKQTDADRAWASFTVRLTELVKDWEALNFDQDFLTWLEGTDSDVDPMPRKQKLQYYVDRLDAPKCARFFQIYKETLGKKAPSTPRPGKEEIIQPTPSAAGHEAPVPGSDDGGPVTVEQYNKAVRDYTQKRISYEELEKISDKFQRAVAKSLGR